jgi:hypothetical protein
LKVMSVERITATQACHLSVSYLVRSRR